MVYFPAARLHGIKHYKKPPQQPECEETRRVVARWEEVKALTLEGLSATDIARELKLDYKTVTKIQMKMHVRRYKRDAKRNAKI